MHRVRVLLLILLLYAGAGLLRAACEPIVPIMLLLLYAAIAGGN